GGRAGVVGSMTGAYSATGRAVIDGGSRSSVSPSGDRWMTMVGTPSSRGTAVQDPVSGSGSAALFALAPAGASSSEFSLNSCANFGWHPPHQPDPPNPHATPVYKPFRGPQPTTLGPPDAGAAFCRKR